MANILRIGMNVETDNDFAPKLSCLAIDEFNDFHNPLEYQQNQEL